MAAILVYSCVHYYIAGIAVVKFTKWKVGLGMAKLVNANGLPVEVRLL